MTAAPDQGLEMSPAERSLEELFREAPITSFLDQELARCDSGVAEVELRHRREFEQGFGVIHGGIVATIADTAGFFAAASLVGPRIATVEFKVNLVAPARDDTLRAVASVVYRSRRLIVCQVRVTGARDVLIALAQATYATVGESSR